MERFEKKDLVYEYTWSHYEKDDHRISGIPDDTEFNRKEGHEVLYIISQLTDHLAWAVENLGNRLEIFIHDRLPAEIKNQKDTIQWIKDNWKSPAVK